jgi:hypothetical protein
MFLINGYDDMKKRIKDLTKIKIGHLLMIKYNENVEHVMILKVEGYSSIGGFKTIVLMDNKNPDLENKCFVVTQSDLKTSKIYRIDKDVWMVEML